jgi:hypothetical protein
MLMSKGLGAASVVKKYRRCFRSMADALKADLSRLLKGRDDNDSIG